MAGLRSNPCSLFQQIEKQQGRHVEINAASSQEFTDTLWPILHVAARLKTYTNCKPFFYRPAHNHVTVQPPTLSRSTTHSSTSSAHVWLLITTREIVLLEKRQHDGLLMKTGVFGKSNIGAQTTTRRLWLFSDWPISVLTPSCGSRSLCSVTQQKSHNKTGWCGMVLLEPHTTFDSANIKKKKLSKVKQIWLDYLVDTRRIRPVRDSIATEHILSFSLQKGWCIFHHIYESTEFKIKLLQIYRLLIWNMYCKLQMIRYIVNVPYRRFTTFLHNHWVDVFSLTISAHTGDKMFSINSTGNQLQQSQQVK